MIALGILLASPEARERFAEFAACPGNPSSIWDLATALCDDEEQAKVIACLKASCDQSTEAKPVAVIMRAFVRSELGRRLREEAFKFSRLYEIDEDSAKESLNASEVLKSHINSLT